MTTDTTMTDVDTSKIAVINIVSALTHMMEKSGGASVEREVLRLAIEKIEALAAERDELSMKLYEAAHTAKAALDRCDELERLAGKMIEAWQTIELQCSDGDGFTHKAHADMHDAIDALTDYQRKGE